MKARAPTVMLVTGTLLCAFVNAPLAAPAECFQDSDNRALRFEVYEQAPPPLGETPRGYAFYPATAFATQDLGRLWGSHTRAEEYYWQWANRATDGVRNARGQIMPRKGNFQPGLNRPYAERTAFTSIAKADACTLAQTAAVLGRDPASVDREAADAGVPVQRLADGATAGVANAADICIVQRRTLPANAAGVLLDFEVQDGRTPQQSFDFLSRFVQLVHKAGRKAFLYSNPLDAPTQAYTGLTDENSGALAHLFDRMSILLWSGNAEHSVSASFEKQMSIVQAYGSGDPGRLVAVFELANTSLSDAQIVHDEVIKRKMAGVMIWRDRVAQGGQCDTPVNEKIACLTLGRCQ